MTDAYEATAALEGDHFEILPGNELYPEALRRIARPPERLYLLGSTEALQEGIAVVGARRATPYGLGNARHFAGLATDAGVPVISGGARGCDAEALRAAVERGAPAVAIIGGGIDMAYPKENHALFQQIVDHGGAIVSEQPWDAPPLPYHFRGRNRIIAGLAKATLIVEAGLPSGVFSIADDALGPGARSWRSQGPSTRRRRRERTASYTRGPCPSSTTRRSTTSSPPSTTETP